MKSFTDAEGAQDFIDDVMSSHLAVAYTSGFRHGVLVGMSIGAAGTVLLIKLMVNM